MFINRTKYLKTIALRKESASRIQRSYRNYRKWSMLPKVWRQHKSNAAIVIQKYLRGYLVFHNHFIDIRKTKLKENEKFFEDMKY